MNQYIFFPQWQGSGDSTEIFYGAKQLLASVQKDYPFHEIEVSLEKEAGVSNKINNFKVLFNQLGRCKRLVNEKTPKKIFTLGGDCGVELIPVSYLNSRYKNMALLWLDAHGDLNTPESSPSSNFHGMPLRTLLGEGNETFLKALISNITPKQVFLVGTRDLDRSEQNYIYKNHVELLTEDNILELPVKLYEKGFEHIYIHLDLDILATDQFPHVKVPSRNGIRIDIIEQLIKTLKDTFIVTGGSILESVPMDGASLDMAGRLLRLVFEK